MKNRRAMRSWPIYLLIAALSIVMVNFTFSLINRPKENEVFNIFIASYGCDGNSIREKLQKQEDYPSGIRRFYVENGILGTSQYDTKKKGLSYSIADLMVFPLSQLDTLDKYSDFCHGFDAKFATDYFHFDENSDFLMSEEKVYGFKVYDASSKNGMFSEYIKYENNELSEDYYLIFKKTSIHLGESVQNSQTDYALIIGRDFLQYGK